MNTETERVEHARRMASFDRDLNFLSEQKLDLVLGGVHDYREGRCSKIQCIKRVKEVTNWGLKDTKDYVEWRVPTPDKKYEAPVTWQDQPDLAQLNKQLEDRIKLLESDLETETSAHSESRNELYTEQDRNAVLRERVRCLASALRELISVVAED